MSGPSKIEELAERLAQALPPGFKGLRTELEDNFRAILRYNNSTSYALAVSLLAQRLAGGPGVQAAWPRELQALSRSQLLDLQTALNARGFDAGKPPSPTLGTTRAVCRSPSRLRMTARKRPNTTTPVGSRGLHSTAFVTNTVARSRPAESDQ